MNASDPASSNKLTDEQLDALLRSADQELLIHIQASTDPTDALTRLLASPATPAGSPPGPDVGDPASRPRPQAHSPRTKSYWRSRLTIRATALTAAVAGAAVVAISIAVAYAVHRSPTVGQESLPHIAAPVHVVPGPDNNEEGLAWQAATPPGSPPFAPAEHSNASGTKITLYVLFSRGQFKPGNAAQLKALLQATAPYTSRIVTIVIDGWANDAPDPTQAVKLATLRAQEVRNWLIAHRIPPCELRAVHEDVPQSIGGSAGGVVITIRYARPIPATRIANPVFDCTVRAT